MVLERFQQPVKIVRQDGFDIHGEIYMELEGSTPATMAKSVGYGVVEFASEFQRLKPDLVLLSATAMKPWLRPWLRLI